VKEKTALLTMDSTALDDYTNSDKTVCPATLSIVQEDGNLLNTKQEALIYINDDGKIEVN